MISSALQRYVMNNSVRFHFILLIISSEINVCACDEQVAEIISDMREPIVPVTQTEDENEKRKRQVKVSLNTNAD